MKNHCDDELVKELIVTVCFSQPGLDTLIETFAKQRTIFGKSSLEENSKEKLCTQFTSDAFLKPFIEKYKEKFSEVEMIILLEIYQTNAMRKFLEIGKELMEPMYFAMQKHVEEIA